MRAFCCPCQAVVLPEYGVADIMAFVFSIPQWPRVCRFTSAAVILSAFLLVRIRACSLLIRSPEIERRQQIVILLLDAGRPQSVGAIAAAMHPSQPAISHHLKILRGSGLVSVQRVGTTRLYALDVDAAALDPLRELADGIGACLAAHT